MINTTKIIIFLFFIQISFQDIQKVPFPNLQLFFNEINYSRKYCENLKQALITEKPVYKNGESVTIVLFSYDFYTKAANIYCKDSVYLEIEIIDSQDKIIGKAEKQFKQEDYLSDYSALVYSFKIEQNLPGGFYNARIQNNSYGEKVSFFVMEYNKKQNGILGDWNLSTIKPGDLIKGKLSFKSLNKTFDQFSLVKMSYNFIDQTGQKIFSSQNNEMKEDVFYINFLVPQNFQNILTVQIQIVADKEEINYMKEFRESLFDQIVIDFNIAYGKIVLGQSNQFYFAAYKTSEKQLPVQINQAQLIKQSGNQFQQLGVTSTQYQGRGSFELIIKEEDVENNSKFFLRVKYSELFSKDYEIIKINNQDFSEIFLDSPKKIVNQNDQFEIKIKNLNYQGQLLLIIQQAIRVYIKKIIYCIKANENPSVFFDLNELPNAGVYTFQLYKPLQNSEQQKNDPNAYGFEFQAKIQLEFDFFVKPSKIIKTDIILNQSKYIPGDQVEFSLKSELGQQFNALIAVLDESVFLEVEEENRAPSILTKIFLEKEVFRQDGKLKFPSQFINQLFISQQKNLIDPTSDLQLELLLGIQIQRKFLFGANEWNKLLQNLYDSVKDEKLKQFQAYFQEGSGSVIMADARGAQPMPEMMMLNAAPKQRIKGASQPMYKRAKIDNNNEVEDEMPVTEKTVKETEKQNNKEENFYTDKNIENSTILMKKFSSYYEKEEKNNFVFILPKSNSICVSIIGLVYDEQGHYGIIQQTILAQKPLNIFADVPTFFIQSEKFILDIITENNSNQIKIFQFTQPEKFSISLEPFQSKNFKMGFETQNIPFKIEAIDQNSQDNLYSVQIQPYGINDGIKQNFNKSSYLTKENSSMKIIYSIPDDFVKNSSTLQICYKNSNIQIILDALDAFNKTPMGCFEQASSSNFPLVLAIKILLKKKEQYKDLLKKMTDNLKVGIKLLLSYETNTGGFEWFGKSPGHATLTAYGLWQFLEISQLKMEEKLFDEQLFERLKVFFKKVKNTQGGFNITQGLDSFGNPDQNTSDIYIILMISKKYQEIDIDFSNEKNYVLGLYEKYSKNQIQLDIYKLALLGLLYQSLNLTDKAEEILNKILENQDKITGKIQNGNDSITKSRGKNLVTETTALSMLLLLDINYTKYSSQLELGIKFLVSQLKQATFGSTQGTILSLMVFDQYFEKISQGNSTGNLNLKIDGLLQQDLQFKLGNISESQCYIFNEEIKNQIKPNSQGEITLQLKDQVQGSYLLSMDLDYYSLLPQEKSSILNFKVQLQESEKILTYKVELKNLENQQQGMTLIQINIPSCAIINLNDLENMKLNDIVDFYEIRNHGSTIVFYWRGLNNYQIKIFNFTLIKQFKYQSCNQRTHQAYLYYSKEESSVYVRA